MGGSKNGGETNGRRADEGAVGNAGANVVPRSDAGVQQVDLRGGRCK
jgi:hypothetical protein